jgi:hypothetical protein
MTPYAFYDDYTDLASTLQGGRWSWTKKIVEGRPTHALLMYLSFSRIDSIADFRYLRFLCILGLALLAWSLYRKLVREGWNYYQALCLSLIICTLPPFQVCVSWGLMAFSPFAALFSGTAFSLAERAFDEQYPGHKLSLATGAILFMLLALTIHQTFAMFFWVYATIVLFQPDLKLSDFLRRFRWFNFIAFAGLILGFGIYKLGMALYGKEALSPERASLTSNIWDKVCWFFAQPILNALNIVNIFPESWPALIVALFIGIGLLLYFRGGVKERLLRSVVALAIIPLSYLPNLVVAENWASYRTQVALTSVIVVYFFLAGWGYGKALRHPATMPTLTAGLGFAALASSLLAARNVSAYFAVPQSRELELMRARLAQSNLANLHGIYLICAGRQDSIAPGVRYDEFGLPSSSQPWTLAPMIYLLLREKNLEQAGIPIEIVPANEPMNPPHDALVIDMHELLKPSLTK